MLQAILKISIMEGPIGELARSVCKQSIICGPSIICNGLQIRKTKKVGRYVSNFSSILVITAEIGFWNKLFVNFAK